MLLNSSFVAPEAVESLSYKPKDHKIGIVHFGVGAFHRAHQADYTHQVLEKSGGDWRILGVSLQSTKGADQLNAQDGIYSLVTRGGDEGNISIKLIGSIAHVVAASRGTERLFETLVAPEVKIVSMTVTEKAYGIHREGGAVDEAHEAIAHDLANPDHPKGIIGIITRALSLRREAGIAPFTVLCCDNLPKNGGLVRDGVVDFARRIDPALAGWISDSVAFPSSMVDRITPAATPDLLSEVSELLGVDDYAAIETEPFTQWVIEDDFPLGRPKWEDAGALFVKDVAPYEHMKLRMLNGSHSLIAYMGFLSGHKYVRDVMADKTLSEVVRGYMHAASQTLAPLENIDFTEYATQLIERFENPNIAHETYQIAMDGTQKLPQRIFEPALDSLKKGLSTKPFAFATAAWMRYVSGQDEDGKTYALRDPREAELQEIFTRGQKDVRQICNAFFALPDFMPQELCDDNNWQEQLAKYLDLMLNQNIDAAISQYRSK